jgi:hypothetical protein
MKRRELLKAAGAVAMVDVEAVGDGIVLSGDTEDDAGTDSEVLQWLPPLSAIPGEDPYDVLITRRFEDDALTDPALLGDAAVHVSLVSPQATVSIGIGADGGGHSLPDRGYWRAGDVEGRPLYARRDRHRNKVAVADSDAVVVGSGSEFPLVESLVRATVSRGRRPLHRTDTEVETAFDLLGSGTLVSVTPTPRLTGDDEDRPLVIGSKLRLRGATTAVRGVGVYPGERESAAAFADGCGLWTDPSDGANVAREGRALVYRDVVATDSLPVVP